MNDKATSVDTFALSPQNLMQSALALLDSMSGFDLVACRLQHALDTFDEVSALRVKDKTPEPLVATGNDAAGQSRPNSKLKHEPAD